MSGRNVKVHHAEHEKDSEWIWWGNYSLSKLNGRTRYGAKREEDANPTLSLWYVNSSQRRQNSDGDKDR